MHPPPASSPAPPEYAYSDAAPQHTNAYVWPGAIRRLPRPPCRVLDAGCGNGAFARRLVGLGYDVTGVDVSITGIALARTHCPAARFEVASVSDDLAGLFGGPFDAIVSLEVVEHLYDPRGFARSAWFALRPGGTLVVSTPYHGYLKNLALAATGKLDAHFTALWDGGHIKFWSRRTLTALLAGAGFEPVAFDGAGRAPYLWRSMVMTFRRP